MPTDKTDELLELLAELRRGTPDWPLGEMVTTLATAIHGNKPKVVWNVTDDDLIAAAHRLLALHRHPLCSPKGWDIHALRKLPAAERDAIMAESAAFAEADYVNDPELTAFEAFGEDDLFVDSSNTESR